MTAFSAFGAREAASLYADQFEIYHGNSNPDLARKICRYLGSEPGKLEVFQFANENIFVKILENVREKDVFLVQPTCHPVNQSIMELLIMIDAFKRASAGRITAVIPYYAYGRSDKKDQPRVPITARLIADMITVAGADRVLTMDLHQGQIQGFFNIPVDELTAVHMLSNYYRHKHIEDPVVVTDLGFAKRARAFAELLDAPLAIIEKRRVGNLDRAELMNVIGEVKGKRAIIVDDEIDTAGTLVEITRALEREGVTEIYACATHGVLSDPAIDRIAASNAPRGRPDRLGAAARRASSSARSRRCRSRRSSARPSAGSTAASRSGRCSRARSRSPRRCCCGRMARRARSTRAASTARSTTGTLASGRDRGSPGRRPMTLQLHKPDGEGGLEPVTDPPEDWRDQLQSTRWGTGLARRPAAEARQPGDEPDLAVPVGPVLARARPSRPSRSSRSATGSASGASPRRLTLGRSLGAEPDRRPPLYSGVS